MYHCHIHFYLTGCQNKEFEIIKEISPLSHFTHTFSESIRPEKALTANADVILAYLHNLDVQETLQALLSYKKESSELILLADKEQVALLSDFLTEIKDIWITPLLEEEILFRFLRWQQTCKMSKDFWQTSHYFDATINHIPNLIWYKDKAGIHKKVNDSFCRTVNKTKEQVEGRGHAYIWDVEQDDPACIESEREVMTKKKTCISEEVIKTKDGTRTLTTYKSPLYDLDGSVMGTVGVAIDITLERLYEQEILQKNHTLETIFTTMDCGVICHSIDGSQIISINRAALKILGYDSQEALQKEGFDMFAASVIEEDRTKLRESIKELKKEGDSVSVEYRVQHKDGKILHIMGNVKLIKENDRLIYQRFLLDCTAQKLQEKRNENRQMRLLQALSIDYSLVCFVELSTGTVLPLQNNSEKSTRSAFSKKIPLKESMELYIQNSVYEDDREMLRQAVSLEHLKEVLADKKLYCVNYRVYKDNEVKYFQMRAVYTGAWDEDHGIVLGFRNVNEEIRNEIKQKNLLEDALLQANRANKAKSVFLSNMSHDIRTPMNAIVGFTTLALNHIERQEQVQEYLKKIMASGNHLLSLINDILDMSRIESGKMRLEETPCRLPDILHGLRSILQAEIRAKQLELYMDAVDVKNEEIFCDKLRLNQVLLNLLSNSVKYTGAGGIVSVRIIEKAGAPEGCASYEFHIKDTGIGMSEEFITHIFEPFEREKNSTLSGIPGTGLGMAITKNIVDMMNGTIEVKSKQGVGTEFVVSFTFRLNSEVKVPQVIPELKDCRALVVDDDFNTCDSVTYMLGQLGMRAEWTLSGKEAVLRTHQAAMRNDNYSVYIIDWLMPDMNGIEVTRRIRQEIGDDVPIIVLTAYDWSDIESEAREAGVAAFCSKPLFFSELTDCLYSVINAEEDNKVPLVPKPQNLHSGRILLAEDNELNQEIAVELLKEAGLDVDVADNGQIAVDMLKKSQPDYYQLILMDVQMPVMNGYEATKTIRKLEDKELASIPILAMTANAFEEDKQAALACGMNGHIAKPIDINKLFESMDKILS